MIAHVFTYAFLAILMAAMLWVVGTPWLSPKPRKMARRRSPGRIKRFRR